MKVMNPGMRFGSTLVLARSRQLLVNHEEVRLGGRAFDLLVALIERRERVVGKDELLDLIWPGLAVEPNNLQVQIWALRRVLGADAIKTIARRGYQWALPLEGPPGSAFTQPTDAGIADVAGGASPCAAEAAGTARAGAASSLGMAPSKRTLSVLAFQLAQRLTTAPWLTLVGASAPQRRLACEAICQAFVKATGLTVWRWRPELGGGALGAHATVQRLARMGGVLVLLEADPEQRIQVARWLHAAPGTDRLRILATSATTQLMAGELHCAVPETLEMGSQAAPLTPPLTPALSACAQRGGSPLRWRERAAIRV